MAAPTYTNEVKAARMTATRDQVNDGTLEIMAANDDVLVVFDLDDPAGSVNNAVWTLAFDETTEDGLSAAGGGTNAAKAQIKNSGGSVRISGLTCGLSGSGAGVILDNLSIADGQSVTISSATITHAPDPT